MKPRLGGRAVRAVTDLVELVVVKQVGENATVPVEVLIERDRDQDAYRILVYVETPEDALESARTRVLDYRLDAVRLMTAEGAKGFADELFDQAWDALDERGLLRELVEDES